MRDPHTHLPVVGRVASSLSEVFFSSSSSDRLFFVPPVGWRNRPPPPRLRPPDEGLGAFSSGLQPPPPPTLIPYLLLRAEGRRSDPTPAQDPTGGSVGRPSCSVLIPQTSGPFSPRLSSPRCCVGGFAPLKLANLSLWVWNSRPGLELSWKQPSRVSPLAAVSPVSTLLFLLPVLPPVPGVNQNCASFFW